ncbi:hypothetical protein ES702_07383 [subsurface metagenome]
MARREFAVPRKGAGKPDFYRTQIPARTILGTGQRNWYFMYSTPIAAGTVITVPVYTVPANWRLYIGSGIICCDDYTNWQRVTWSIKVPGIPELEIGDVRYKVFENVLYPDTGVIILEAGYALSIDGYNLDPDDPHNFSGQILGMMEQV